MTQTAVEWLEFRYKNNINLNQYDFEQAKEIQKQQIIQSNRDGVDMIINEKHFISGEQYYNEMFEEEVLLQSSIDGEVIWGKLKKERMYSEEDMMDYSNYRLLIKKELSPKEWFEQFKNK
jgi:hypothetical protein